MLNVFICYYCWALLNSMFLIFWRREEWYSCCRSCILCKRISWRFLTKDLILWHNRVLAQKAVSIWQKKLIVSDFLETLLSNNSDIECLIVPMYLFTFIFSAERESSVGGTQTRNCRLSEEIQCSKKAQGKKLIIRGYGCRC